MELQVDAWNFSLKYYYLVGFERAYGNAVSSLRDVRRDIVVREEERSSLFSALIEQQPSEPSERSQDKHFSLKYAFPIVRRIILELLGLLICPAMLVAILSTV